MHAEKQGIKPIAANLCEMYPTHPHIYVEIRDLLKRNIEVMKQSISDKKLFILMRQMYPDKKIINDSETKLLLDDLRKRIEEAHCELETFKNRGCSLY